MDDVATYRYFPPVYYYLGRVREGMKGFGSSRTENMWRFGERRAKIHCWRSYAANSASRPAVMHGQMLAMIPGCRVLRRRPGFRGKCRRASLPLLANSNNQRRIRS